jgi:hypothetical protein
MEANKEREIKDLITKAAEGKKGKLDLSSDEDLSIAVMNLISIEEHFFFTGAKTGKPDYYDLLAITREMRKDLLKKLITEYEGEVWCISKHLLAASMRLMEVGTKQMGMGNKAQAEDLFSKAYDLYSLFWAVNMKQIDMTGLKKIGDDELNIHDNPAGNKKDEEGVKASSSEQSDPMPVTEGGKLQKFRDMVKKMIDCCIE